MLTSSNIQRIPKALALLTAGMQEMNSGCDATIENPRKGQERSFLDISVFDESFRLGIVEWGSGETITEGWELRGPPRMKKAHWKLKTLSDEGKKSTDTASRYLEEYDEAVNVHSSSDEEPEIETPDYLSSKVVSRDKFAKREKARKIKKAKSCLHFVNSLS